MSATTSVAATPPRRTRGRFRSRWRRVVIPFAVLALLVTVTMVARSREEPDLGEAETLSPASTGPDGSSRLADMLLRQGVEIQQVDSVEAAEAALGAAGDAVLFIPKSTLAGAWLAGNVARDFANHRVVLVAPSSFQLTLTGLPVLPGQRRWAADDRLPDCTVPEAVAGGRATALRGRYSVEDPEHVCYDGGLVRTQVSGAEVFVVGATDPFRNRRIREHGNAELAVALLGARDRVIWAGALPIPDGNINLPDINAPDRGERLRERDCGYLCLFSDYPQPVQVALALAALLALLLALARARRLGPPVSEPLPVAVPAAEVVAGRGRLYQRTQGRGVALGALRSAAMPPIVRGLGLPPAPPPEPETVIRAAAARTGLPPDRVRHILYGPDPENDEDLMNAVAALDALVAAVTQDRPRS